MFSDKAAVSQHGSRFVQYGCGLSAPSGWRNFDASPTLRLQRLPVFGRLITRGRVRFPANVEFGDIVRGLPVANKSCDVVYCSHVLEHLSLEDARTALGETYRILKSGGIFRGVLPDLEFLVRGYVADPTPGAAVKFVRNTLLGIERRTKGIKGVVEQVLGNSNHLWMWDYKSLAAELEDAGFKGVRRATFGDCSIEFAAVENEERWRDSLGFECRR